MSISVTDKPIICKPESYFENTNYVWGVCHCAILGEGLKIPKIKGKSIYKAKCLKCGCEITIHI